MEKTKPLDKLSKLVKEHGEDSVFYKCVSNLQKYFKQEKDLEKLDDALEVIRTYIEENSLKTERSEIEVKFQKKNNQSKINRNAPGYRYDYHDVANKKITTKPLVEFDQETEEIELDYYKEELGKLNKGIISSIINKKRIQFLKKQIACLETSSEIKPALKRTEKAKKQFPEKKPSRKEILKKYGHRNRKRNKEIFSSDGLSF